ncbi:RGS22 protein, partial [Polypterus senegalus]
MCARLSTRHEDTADFKLPFLGNALSDFSEAKKRVEERTPARFNKDIGAFEIVNDAEEALTNRVKALLYNYKPKHPVYDVIRKTTKQFLQLKPEPNPELEINNSYIVKTLEREQGLAWVRKERLPYFLQSDCYFEYRIAKLLSQVECSAAGMKLQIDSGYRPWSVTKKISPPSSSEGEMELIMRKYYASLGQASFTQSKEWFTLAKGDQEMVTTQSLQIPLTSIQMHEDLLLHQKKSRHHSISESLGMESVEEVTSSVDEDFSTADSFKGSRMVSSYQSKKSKSIDDECFASVPDSPSHAPHSAFMEFRSESAIEAEKPTQLSEEKSYKTETQSVFVEENAYVSEHESLHSAEVWSDEELEDVDGEAYDDGHNIGPKYYKFLTRKAVEKFKSFLQGTLGEKYWHLWMDIERLKAIKDTRWKYRQRIHSAGSLTSCSFESTISSFSESSKDSKEDLSETLSLWKNGVHFWFDLQEYHRLFYQETFSPFKLGRQSQFLYSTYIQFGGPMDIAIDLESQYTMYQKLDPPFEDLFDIAEEYILTMLLIPWMQMLESDKTNFKKVELMEETRYLDSVYYRKLQALRQKSASLQKQVKHLAGGAGKILKEKMSAPALVEVQKHVQNRIEKKWLPQYLATPDFSERQKNKLEMEDVDEEEESQVPKSKKKKEAWKLALKSSICLKSDLRYEEVREVTAKVVGMRTAPVRMRHMAALLAVAES